MKKLIQISSIVISVIAIVFTFLPLDSIGIIPVSLAILFSLINLSQAKGRTKKMAKIIFYLALATIVLYIGKQFLIADKIEKDQQFDLQKIETKEEAKKVLEELE